MTTILATCQTIIYFLVSNVCVCVCVCVCVRVCVHVHAHTCIVCVCVYTIIPMNIIYQLFMALSVLFTWAVDWALFWLPRRGFLPFHS